MNTLLFMKEAVDHFNLSLYKPTYDKKQGLYMLQAIYKDLQHKARAVLPSIGAKELVENEEFLRYCAERLDNTHAAKEVGGLYFRISTLLLALHEYEHKYDTNLDCDGFSSLQRIALARYVADFISGNAYDALRRCIDVLGEYLLEMDAEKEDANIEALSRIDAMRLAALNWYPAGYSFVDLTYKAE